MTNKIKDCLRLVLNIQLAGVERLDDLEARAEALAEEAKMFEKAPRRVEEELEEVAADQQDPIPVKMNNKSLLFSPALSRNNHLSIAIIDNRFGY